MKHPDPLEEALFLGKDEQGSARFASPLELAGRLHGRVDWITVEALKREYGISEARWSQIAAHVGGAYARMTEGPHDQLVAEVNARLAELALAMPTLCTLPELNRLSELTASNPLPVQEIERLLSSLVMRPATRAMLLRTRFMNCAITKSVAYIIDSSYFAYVRGNVVASYMTILPCIEGVLRRWHEISSKNKSTIDITNLAVWIARVRERSPLATNRALADSWANTCSRIMRDHLFKNTSAGRSFGDFNRHVALHALDQGQYCTPSNLLRAYTLLDMLVELFIWEQRLVDPLLVSRHDDWQSHADAYQSAAIAGVIGGAATPENALWVHTEYNFRRVPKGE